MPFKPLKLERIKRRELPSSIHVVPDLRPFYMRATQSDMTIGGAPMSTTLISRGRFFRMTADVSNNWSESTCLKDMCYFFRDD